jgi:hypothetical protein
MSWKVQVSRAAWRRSLFPGGRAGVVLAWAAASAVVLGGCGGGSARSTGLDGALSAYHRDSYSLAFDRASAAERSGDPADRSRAALIAGQSAMQLGRLNEARLYLDRAARSTQPDVRARAVASLGLIRFAEGEHREAARLLLEAAPGLDSADQSMARRFAARAYEAAGEPQKARAALSQGGDSIAHLSTSRFALQVGAFRERYRAERAARTAEADARTVGPDPVRIVTKTDDSTGLLHIVQFGSWNSRQAASRARSRLGHVDYFVARAIEPAAEVR